MLIYCSPPTQGDEDVVFSTIVATSTNSVGACLKQIPNQPIVFQVFTYPIILKRLTRKGHNRRPSHGYIVKLGGLDQKSAVQNSQLLWQGY